ncbi:hypothetical protein COLO4_25482 [Corchorus olitorius]|uniref:Uncharacterized protein n=1 Tax=Corchorus olitorius TaxID=93759 RepID=A0A1R3I277_9ROSI|nr:hypothetical protein COLO4_25482 [Corchorus olitorius]
MAPLISFHHIGGLAPIFPNKTQIHSLKILMEPYRVDPSRILQQSFCYDNKRKWSIAIAWGYTIQIYPWLVNSYELHMPLQTFKTWRSWSNGPFTFNTRPMPADHDPCKWPIIYFLDQIDEVGMGGTRTRYKIAKSGKACKNADFALAMTVNSITVSSKKMAPDYWQKAPHRQCCEIMDKGRIKSGNMQIKIRNCRPSETATTI